MGTQQYTEEQKAIIAHRDGPAFVVAGAGTGKTFTMTARVAALVESGVDPSSILVLTFTNAAAREMKERVRKNIGKLSENVTACTYHSFCNILMHRYGVPCRDYTILDTGDDEDLIRLVKANSRFADIKLPRANTLRDIYSRRINCRQSYEQILSDPKYETYMDMIEDIKAFYPFMQAYKEEHRMVNYDDMLVTCEKLLKSSVGNRVRDQYRYVMVDEAQDTNGIQYDITNLLSENIMYIGDPEQSIYGFRGSDLDLYLSVPKMHPGTKIYTLSSNYRCTQEILDVANSIIEEDEIPYKAILKTGKGHFGPKPNLCMPLDQDEEASTILDKILASGGDETNAVIYRNSALSAKLELELVRQGIEYTKRGGVKFFEMDCIRDMMAIFRIIVNRHDNLSWFRILQKNRLIGEKRASQILDGSSDPVMLNPFRGKNNKTAIEVCVQLDRMQNFLTRVEDMDPAYQAECAKNFYIGLLEKNLELLKKNKKVKETTTQAAEAVVNTAKTYIPILLELMKDSSSMQDFLDSISLDMTAVSEEVASIGQENEGQASTGNASVVLTTIHSAKGLEWDHVHIMDVIDGVFPKIPFMLDEEEKEKSVAEERRCMYVAATRAKDTLTFYCPESIVVYGRWYPGALSRFLKGAAEKQLIIQEEDGEETA